MFSAKELEVIKENREKLSRQDGNFEKFMESISEKLSNKDQSSAIIKMQSLTLSDIERGKKIVELALEMNDFYLVSLEKGQYHNNLTECHLQIKAIRKSLVKYSRHKNIMKANEIIAFLKDQCYLGYNLRDSNNCHYQEIFLPYDKFSKNDIKKVKKYIQRNLEKSDIFEFNISTDVLSKYSRIDGSLLSVGSIRNIPKLTHDGKIRNRKIDGVGERIGIGVYLFPYLR